MSYCGWDENGKAYTFDLWCMWAGWDGGTIHEAFRYFKDMPMSKKDEFCSFLINALDHNQIKDLENGFASQFTRMRLGVR